MQGFEITRQLSKVGAASWALGFVAAPGSALAQFSLEQEQAFGIAVGGALSGDLNDLIAGFIAVLLFIAIGVLTYAAYQRWVDGKLNSAQVTGLLLRASLLVTVAGIFLR